MSLDKRALDAHITGLYADGADTLILTCPEGHGEWTTELYFELGAWFDVDSEKGFCPVCDLEGLEPHEHQDKFTEYVP